MSTIFLDPVEMDAMAGHVSDHVDELMALATDLESACSATVPVSLAGWLAEELRDITVSVNMIALLYALAALDTALRAQQIQADQSLATATPSLAAAGPTFASATVIGGFSALASSSPDSGTAGSHLVGGVGGYGSPTAGSALTSGAPLVGGTFLGSSGGFGAVEMRMQSSAEFLAANPLLALANGASAGVGSPSLPIFDIPGYDSTNTLLNSRPGATFIGNGRFEGSDGRIGSQIYRNPDEPGSFLVG